MMLGGFEIAILRIAILIPQHLGPLASSAASWCRLATATCYQITKQVLHISFGPGTAVLITCHHFAVHRHFIQGGGEKPPQVLKVKVLLCTQACGIERIPQSWPPC
jgi:hypothetical protein